MRNIYFASSLVIGLLMAKVGFGEVMIQRSNLMEEIVCSKGSIELVLDRSLQCMAYSTYELDLTPDKINHIQHYCYEGSLETYGCNGYRLVISTSGF